MAVASSGDKDCTVAAERSAQVTWRSKYAGNDSRCRRVERKVKLRCAEIGEQEHDRIRNDTCPKRGASPTASWSK